MRVTWHMNQPGNDIGEVVMSVPDEKVVDAVAAIQKLGFEPTVSMES
jgi:hypothetical protein